MQDGFNDPEKRRKAIGALVCLTPVAFALGYGFVYLTQFRPTPRLALIAGTSSAGLCLLFAGVLAAFGREWMSALRVVAVIIGVVTFLVEACASKG